MLDVFNFSDTDRLSEVFVRQCWVQDFVAVLFQGGRCSAADDAGPAVKKLASHDRFPDSYVLSPLSCVMFTFVCITGKFSSCPIFKLETGPDAERGI
jgi:hypothetical protein